MTPASIRRRWLPVGAGLVAVGLLAACAPAGDTADAGVPVSAGADGPYRGTEVDPPFALPDEAFTDTDGRTRTVGEASADAGGDATVLLFAYTRCPDVCNAQLAALAAALRRSSADVREKVGVVMITADPERDDADAIRRYLDGFDEDYAGLRADLSTTTAAGTDLGVSIERGEDSGDGYRVDHTAALFGFDDQGRGVVLWQPGVAVNDLVDDLRTLVAA